MSEEQWLFEIHICDAAQVPEESLPQAKRGGEGRPNEAMRSIDEVEAGVGCFPMWEQCLLHHPTRLDRSAVDPPSPLRGFAA
ncbi:hypothetical protein [Tardiphaga sp. 813_E8_N1_3]|uniref:hypothetical protein n=1 Tax=Tardiphaga sp. 813_E8_N1_3 TaxID=3240760 RepID=UPI003F200954